MDHPAGVAVIESFGHGDSRVDHHAQRERALAQQGAKAFPHNNGHDEEEGALVAAEVIDRDDGWSICATTCASV